MFIYVILGIFVWLGIRCLVNGLYTVEQNERALVTTFGRVPRFGSRTSLDDPSAALLSEDQRKRYVYPQVQPVMPGLHFKWPWQRVHKVSIATQTASIAFDPDSSIANQKGTVLEAVTKDQLNTGLKGQIRYAVNERNLYAYVFGVKRPVSHVMGYFVSVLREKIAGFEAPARSNVSAGGPAAGAGNLPGVSINDLRKNLMDLNRYMEDECRSSVPRYGITLEAALITEIDPPPEVESALAAINTAHNQVSSEISLAQAAADQKIVQSRRAVEIETLKAQAEVQLIRQLSEQLGILKKNGPGAMRLYLRNIRLKLFNQAKRVVMEGQDK